VNEEGVPVLVNFIVDHPFNFFVREVPPGAILLTGHILDPLT
jgi:serine protease inhibitor